MPELFDQRDDLNATSDDDEDSVDDDEEEKDVECLGLTNRVGGDGSNDEREENKIDLTPLEAIRKSMNMIIGFLLD